MGSLVLFIVLGLVALAGVSASVGQLLLERRVTREVAGLIAARFSSVEARAVEGLPPPAARYRQMAVGSRAPIRTLRMRHGGTFCTKPGARPLAIRGEQVFAADTPGFVWSARIGMAPGLWVDARDMAVSGKGSMRVLLDATVPIVDAQGPEIDQGAALRLLAEMVWYPTSLFDPRYVTWSAVDDRHARATLRFGERKVSGVFEFGSDGLPVAFVAARFMDGGGLRPWGGVYRDWRPIAGMLVPFEALVTWQLESGPYTYAHWMIEDLNYDDPSLGLCHSPRCG